MYLVIDAGNTNLKYSIYEKSQLVFQDAIAYTALISGTFLFQERDFDIQVSIICNVSGLSVAEIMSFFPPCRYITFSHMLPMPLYNAYATPHTLGMDRLAAALGAEYLRPKTNKLVIDMGTAITIDFVDETATYQGGNISLGMSARYHALHSYSARLPLVSPHKDTTLYGKTTDEAINNGVVLGIIHEIDEYVYKYRAEYQDVAVFLTGGDSLFFENKLKNPIFANENLVALGLLSVLRYNEK